MSNTDTMDNTDSQKQLAPEQLARLDYLEREKSAAPTRRGVSRALSADGVTLSSILKEKIGNIRDQFLRKLLKSKISKEKNKRVKYSDPEVDWTFFEDSINNPHIKNLKDNDINPVQFRFNTDDDGKITGYGMFIAGQGIYRNDSAKSPNINNILSKTFGDPDIDSKDRNPTLDTGKFSVGGQKEYDNVGGTHTFISLPDDGGTPFYAVKKYPARSNDWQITEYDLTSGTCEYDNMYDYFPDTKKCLDNKIAFSAHICDHPVKHITHVDTIINELKRQIYNDWNSIDGDTILDLFSISYKINNDDVVILEKEHNEDKFKESTNTYEFSVLSHNEDSSEDSSDIIVYETDSHMGIVKEYGINDEISFGRGSLPENGFKGLKRTTKSDIFKTYEESDSTHYVFLGTFKIKMDCYSELQSNRYTLIRNRQVINELSTILGGPGAAGGRVAHASQNKLSLTIEFDSRLDKIFNVQHSKEKAALDSAVPGKIRATIILCKQLFTKDLEKKQEKTTCKYIKSQFPKFPVPYNTYILKHFRDTSWKPFVQKKDLIKDKYFHSMKEVDEIIEAIRKDLMAIRKDLMAKKIQSVYRGYLIRKNLPELEAAAAEAAEAAEAAAVEAAAVEAAAVEAAAVEAAAVEAAAVEAAAVEAAAEAAAVEAAAEAAAVEAAAVEAAAVEAAAVEAEAAVAAVAAVVEPDDKGIHFKLYTQEVSGHSRTLTPDLTDKENYWGIIIMCNALKEFALENLQGADDTEKKKRPEFKDLSKLVDKIIS